MNVRRPSLPRVLAALLAALALLLFTTVTHVTLAATTAAEVAAGDEVEGRHRIRPGPVRHRYPFFQV